MVKGGVSQSMRLTIPPGHRFTRLTVVGEGPLIPRNGGRTHRSLLCKCDCGAQRAFPLTDLRQGKTRSCGCLRDETQGGPKKHGMSYTAMHHLWRGMKDRCSNPKNKDFHSYGGRGIKVSDLWVNDFAAFAAHVGDRPDGMTLDRIDTNGNYEPGNVRWATAKQQRRNSRNNWFVLVGGERMALAEACERLGISRQKAYDHLKSGGTYESLHVID